MRTLLVTGASGFLGWHVCTAACAAGWRVVGVAHAHADAIEGVEMRMCDLCEQCAVGRLVAEIAPDAVLHLAAVSQPNVCESDPHGSSVLNVGASLHLASLCAARRLRLVFTSSDLVFDGTRAPYRENDPVRPISEYGRQKAAAEIGIRERCADAVICRLPLMFGTASGPGKSFLQPLMTSLARGEPVRLFFDEFRTPVSGRDAAVGILTALERGSGRVYHLGGRERTSRYEFGLLLARLMRAPERLIVPVRRCDIPMPAPRPADVSLDSGRAAGELGFCPGRLEDELRWAAGTTT